MIRTLFVCLLLVCASRAAFAQPLGTFRWQLQPYCNVVTLNVTQTGSVYTLDGFDDQCGAATVAPLTGTAIPNPNGTIELGLNIVASPGGAPVHVAVPLSIATLGGTWRDSTGNSGAFVFTPGASTGGNQRAASAAIGAVAVDSAQVQLRVSGTCAAGQLVQRINQDGTVACAAGGTGGMTQLSAGPGLAITGGGAIPLSIGLRTTDSGAFDLSNAAGLGAPRQRFYVSDSVTGGGSRFVWFPSKAAIRAGVVTAAEWDVANVGYDSAAFGSNVTASGLTSFAAGSNATSAASAGAAIGLEVSTSGTASVAMGSFASAANGGFAFGDRSVAQIIASGPNQFNVRAVGGSGFYTNTVLTAGVELAPGASAWASVSDANMKEHFKDLDSDDVLAKLARMPIREWNYKAQDAAVRHVGPTAQDFHAAFGLGEDPLRISTIDADGIALAGVKALALENRELKIDIASLRERLERLERKQP